MSFGASHLIRGLSALSLPEGDPNQTPPAEDRVFLSPPSPPQSAVAWIVGSDGLSGAIVELWVEVDGAWRRAGAAFAVNDPSLSSDTSIPNDARLFARVLASSAGEGAALAVGFRLAAPLTPSALVSSGLVVTSPPLVGDPGFGVYVIGSVSVGIEGLTTVNAALAPTAPGLPVRLEIEDRIPPLELGRTPVIVYGSEGQRLRQTAGDFNLRAELAVGAALVDPRQIRILTTADAVTAAQGAAAALSGSWPVRLTDGASVLGTLANPIRVDPTGTTTQPVGDAGGSLTIDSPQLPAALESTRLAVGLGLAGAALSVSNPAPVRPSDGTQFATVTSRVSSANSSAAPLAGGATFVGTYEEVAQYATISVQVFADVASATDGLKVEFSTDGTNLDNDDTFTIPAAKGKVFTFGASARYVRVRYVNGASPQAAFRMQTIFHHVPPKPSSHKLTVDLVDEDDAELVRAVIAARKPDGTYTNIAADTDGNLIVTTPNQAAEQSGLAAGRIVLASTTPTAVRATAYTEQTANAQRSLVSASAADAAAGTGARTVQITYFAADLSGPFTETVTLNGTTPVNTVATNVCFIRRMLVMTAGSGLSNAGIISLKAAAGGGGATIGTIAAGDNRTIWGHHYVPNGVSARITGFACGIKGTDTAGFEIRYSNPLDPTSAEFVISDQLRCPAGAQAPMRIYGAPLEVDGPARITIYVLPDSSSSRTYYATFDFFEEDET